MRSTEEIQNALNICGGKLPETARFLGISYPTLFEHVKKRGLEFKNQAKTADHEAICELYSEIQNVTKVAQQLGYTRIGVKNILRKYKVQITQPIRYEFDERFFSKDNEKSFYWAGFCLADGNVRKNKLSLGLASKDISHLESLKKDLNSNHPISTYLVRNKYYSSQITFVSKFLPKDLERFNIVPRKTLICTFPEWLVKHPLVHHFMRGYFDGDGCWSMNFARKIAKASFSVAGTKEFLLEYNEILKINSLVKTENKKIKNKGSIGELAYSGNGVCSKIRDFIYKDATVFLERKYNIVKDVKVTYPNLCQ